jgi:hypothetical protein
MLPCNRVARAPAQLGAPRGARESLDTLRRAGKRLSTAAERAAAGAARRTAFFGATFHAQPISGFLHTALVRGSGPMVYLPAHRTRHGADETRVQDNDVPRTIVFFSAVAVNAMDSVSELG